MCDKPKVIQGELFPRGCSLDWTIICFPVPFHSLSQWPGSMATTRAGTSNQDQQGECSGVIADPWNTQSDETLKPNRGQNKSRGCFWEAHCCLLSWQPPFPPLDISLSVWKLQSSESDNHRWCTPSGGQDAPTCVLLPGHISVSLAHLCDQIIGLALSWAHMIYVCVYLSIYLRVRHDWATEQQQQSIYLLYVLLVRRNAVPEMEARSIAKKE